MPDARIMPPVLLVSPAQRSEPPPVASSVPVLTVVALLASICKRGGLVGVDRPLISELLQAGELAGSLDRVVDVGQRDRPTSRDVVQRAVGHRHEAAAGQRDVRADAAAEAQAGGRCPSSSGRSCRHC